jgi:hypothetical protein
MDIVGDVVVDIVAVEMDNTKKVRPKTAAFPTTPQCPFVRPLASAADLIFD